MATNGIVHHCPRVYCPDSAAFKIRNEYKSLSKTIKIKI